MVLWGYLWNWDRKWVSNSKEAKAMDTGIIENLVKDFSNSRC